MSVCAGGFEGKGCCCTDPCLTRAPSGESPSPTSVAAAYKHADGKKIDGRRVLVDVERGRTVKGWRPRRLGEYILPSGLLGLFVGHFAFNLCTHMLLVPLHFQLVFSHQLHGFRHWCTHRHLHMSAQAYPGLSWMSD